MKKTTSKITTVIIAIGVMAMGLTGCGSFAQFSGTAPAPEYVMCSNSAAGGAMAAVTGRSEVLKITTQGDISKRLNDGSIKVTCDKENSVLTISPAGSDQPE